MAWKWRARRRCHGTIACCQYVDTPLCNGSLEPHRLARLRQRWMRRRYDSP